MLYLSVTLTAGKPPVRLSPLELAVGEELAKSRKRRRELVDMSYHRSAYLLIITITVRREATMLRLNFLILVLSCLLWNEKKL